MSGFSSAGSLAAIKAQLKSDQGASLVTFKRDGDGAVPLDLQALLRAGLAVLPGHFGAVKNVQVDQSAKLQAAWDAAAAAGVPFVVDGVYWIAVNDKVYTDGIQRKVGVQVPSNSRCLFTPGAALKTLPTDAPVHYPMNFYLADNFEVWNPVVYGERNAHIGAGGESGNCFNIVSCTNGYVHRPVAYDAWGDGIYLGVEYWSQADKQTSDITIYEPKVYRARRNGISVCSGVNLRVIRPYIEDVDGTWPKAGMDLEPEGEGKTKPVCDNWRIEEPTTKNCVGGGINVFTNAMQGGKVDIYVSGHKDTGSTWNAVVTHTDAVTAGAVVFDCPRWHDAAAGGLIFRTTTNGPRLEVRNPVVQDCGAAQAVLSGRYDAAFVFLRDNGYPAAPILGNFAITGARVRDTRAVKKVSEAFYSYDEAGGNAKAFTNAVIEVVEDNSVGAGAVGMFCLPDPTVKVSQPQAMTIKDDVTRHNNFFNRVTLPNDAPKNAVVFLGAVRQPIYGLNLSPANWLKFTPAADSRIYPICNAAGQSIYAQTPGASVNLIPVGTKDWVAEVVSGTWLSA